MTFLIHFHHGDSPMQHNLNNLLCSSCSVTKTCVFIISKYYNQWKYGAHALEHFWLCVVNAFFFNVLFLYGSFKVSELLFT